MFLMVAAVAALHVIGWGLLLGGAGLGIGLGVTAYTLGMRHAFDVDHIAAIDNTVRKLQSGERRPVTVGFWFALGHSTVVFVMVGSLAAGAHAVAGSIGDPDSGLHRWTSVFGTAVSGIFLLGIGLMNVASLITMWRVFRGLRRGEYSEPELERALAERGVVNRVLAPLLRGISKPWHMYPIGVLFGLGFDTVTEVALLVMAGGAVISGLPWYAIVVLPVLFSAGMSLFDAADGVFMSHAYRWAFAAPVRRIYYNLVVTGLSVAVALLVGTQGLITLLIDERVVRGGVWEWIGDRDLGQMGYIVVGLFALTWAAAVAVWYWGNIERRWSHR